MPAPDPASARTPHPRATASCTPHRQATASRAPRQQAGTSRTPLVRATASSTPRQPADAPLPRPATPRKPLLRPVDLGRLRLPNRVVMAPLTRGRATGPDLAPTELHALYYAQRAAAGLTVTEATWVSERAIGFPGAPGIFTDGQVAAWRRVTDVVHAAGGRIVLQLGHAGAASHPDHLGGARPAGPSAVGLRERCRTPAGRKDTVTPRPMTTAEVAATVADYGRAAENARRAGFDGVEVPAAGSYLISQFLNPRLNHRTDRYGGDAAGRRRLLLEIVEAAAVAGGIVGVRLSPYWSAARFGPDARTLAEYDALVAELDARPVTYLHLRGRDLPHRDAAPDLGELARYSRPFTGPVIANNGFTPASANAAVAAGVADAVSFARAYIANPDLVTRIALDHALTPGDRETYYTGGARGYVDYPNAVRAPSPTPAQG